jgi:hypothetical protein
MYCMSLTEVFRKDTVKMHRLMVENPGSAEDFRLIMKGLDGWTDC